jgi:methylmalonyl-CoA/ethylmalonyl-CoA epimerase
MCSREGIRREDRKAADLCHCTRLGGESIYKEFMERHGSGMHHIGLIVSDYQESFQKMVSLGFQHSQGGPIVGTDREGRFDYFDTEAAMSTTIELLDMPTLPPPEPI